MIEGATKDSCGLGTMHLRHRDCRVCAPKRRQLACLRLRRISRQEPLAAAARMRQEANLASHPHPTGPARHKPFLRPSTRKWSITPYAAAKASAAAPRGSSLGRRRAKGITGSRVPTGRASRSIPHRVQASRSVRCSAPVAVPLSPAPALSMRECREENRNCRHS